MTVAVDDRERRIVRLGNTVRRPVGYWTPAVHALLNHLERVGFTGSPRVVGVDSEYETLTFVDGDASVVSADEEILSSVGQLIRRYHDAAATFVPPNGARWQPTSIPTTGGLVCHNDLYLGNFVFDGRAATGIIDFDFAHPADPLWDLAMAAWHWVPLAFEAMSEFVPESQWPARLRLFVDSYGVPSPRRPEVLSITTELTRRMRANRARAGEPTKKYDESLAALDRRRIALLDALSH